jgi:hypothetical protein
MRATVALCVRNTGVLAKQFFANENYLESQTDLKDLLLVGPGKPMGYLPLGTIQARGRDPIELAVELKAAGLQTRIYTQNECGVASGALYVWDDRALKNLLGRYQNVLHAVGWKDDPADFVAHVACEAVSATDFPELYALIGIAFSDPRFAAAMEGFLQEPPEVLLQENR